MIELIRNPSYDFLVNQVEIASKNIVLCTPDLDDDIISDILLYKNKDVKVTLITSLNIASFLEKENMISLYNKMINEKNEIYNYKNFNARFYVFDDEIVWITSSSLTKEGLNTNYEYGILTNEEKIIKEVVLDYRNIIKDKDSKSLVNKDVVNISKNVQTLKNNNVEVVNQKLELKANDILSLKNTLRGWNYIVFEAIDKNILKETFVLSDIYEYEEEFKKSYPTNNFIKDKIRQILQNLRNLGFIEFIDDNGTYKKNWKNK
ncbi:phospholipase D-like domain-containing protein [Haploplasma axanthum]|uniref:Dam-replacing family n=1 Tax=Haploplasma axanthum TaxID=29552 RepID=A0A449BBR9_HAPAX|nr:phospholipase D-like domain-containing protein [Haploplasma axanthum]VEU79893.1 Dam-replacing family [Haploplasma axanthum]